MTSKKTMEDWFITCRSLSLPGIEECLKAKLDIETIYLNHMFNYLCKVNPLVAVKLYSILPGRYGSCIVRGSYIMGITKYMKIADNYVNKYPKTLTKRYYISKTKNYYADVRVLGAVESGSITIVKNALSKIRKSRYSKKIRQLHSLPIDITGRHAITIICRNNLYNENKNIISTITKQYSLGMKDITIGKLCGYAESNNLVNFVKTCSKDKYLITRDEVLYHCAKGDALEIYKYILSLPGNQKIKPDNVFMTSCSWGSMKLLTYIMNKYDISNDMINDGIDMATMEYRNDVVKYLKHFMT